MKRLLFALLLIACDEPGREPPEYVPVLTVDNDLCVATLTEMANSAAVCSDENRDEYYRIAIEDREGYCFDIAIDWDRCRNEANRIFRAPHTIDSCRTLYDDLSEVCHFDF